VDASHRCVAVNRGTGTSGEIRPLVVRHVVFILRLSHRHRSSVTLALGRLVSASDLSPVAWLIWTVSALANKQARSPSHLSPVGAVDR
jgi:hypothetical protein